MHLTRAALALTAVTLLVIVPAVAGQDMPPLPKPGPEHQVFKLDEGTWDAAIEIIPGPGMPPLTSKGVETNVVGCGGLCLITDMKGEMMPGVPFHGHGTSAYDSTKKKYIGSWTDSMTNGLLVGESTYDPASKSMTGQMEGPDMTGKITKMKSVVQYTAADTRVFTMYAPGPDGKEAVGMRITYKKRP